MAVPQVITSRTHGANDTPHNGAHPCRLSLAALEQFLKKA
jgi:hypothetical protein